MSCAVRISGVGKYVLFVYGTLTSDGEEHEKMDGAVLLGRAETAPEYALIYVDDGYIALTQGSDSIPGELYAVSEEKLVELDGWESDHFTRREVVMSDGSSAQAFFLND